MVTVGNGLNIAAGTATIAGGLDIAAGGVSVSSGNVQQFGSLSVTSSSLAAAALDAAASFGPAFTGNGVFGNLPAGTTTANAILLQTSTPSTLFQVTVTPCDPCCLCVHSLCLSNAVSW